MIAVRRLYLLAGALAVAAAGCVVVALLRNDHLEDAAPAIEGAYFGRSVGESEDGGKSDFVAWLDGNVLDSFSVGNAYLWVGAAGAFALAALALALLAGIGSRQRRPSD